MVIRYVNRERKDFSELIDHITYELERWDYDNKLRDIVIEDAASGTQALQVIPVSSDHWLSSRVRGVPAVGSKVENWEAASLWCGRGMVLLPHPSPSVPWLYDFESEIFNVPDTTFNDQADSFAHLINYVESTQRVFSTRWRAMQATMSRQDLYEGIAGLAGNPMVVGRN
jgi:phage terminase large subunit-like protein